ncbi:hypothetical protein [Candidatus Azobacteroides pseudotrichonymphae]|uniref:Uncharacterized protein n=1 Tax=Azobacteroides pseudotrichonymphae genomovar. CFP2 TaxID=511995 RepID=B6YS52_AZOPC|nr:hypothetical protein [Candidatus Azobacteroides pseudotrichonymphae]BAG84024.1 hypothetical protein CFPG_P1-3 [Candidatus Azobacteroides pseudotrichonymphae genomovar. CFP2]
MNNKLIGTMKRFLTLIFLSVFVLGLQAETTLDYLKAIRYGELKCGQHYFLVEHPRLRDNEYIKGSADNEAEGLTDDSIVYVGDVKNHFTDFIDNVRANFTGSASKEETKGIDTLTVSIGIGVTGSGIETEFYDFYHNEETRARIGGIFRRESVVYDTKNVSAHLALNNDVFNGVFRIVSSTTVDTITFHNNDISINTGVEFHNSCNNPKNKVFAGFDISSLLYPTISTNISMNTGYKYTFSNGLYLSPKAVVGITRGFQLSPSASMTAGYDHTFSNGLYLSPKAVVSITRDFPLSSSASMTAGYNHTFSNGLYLFPKAEVGVNCWRNSTGYNDYNYNYRYRYGNFGLEVGYKFHVN